MAICSYLAALAACRRMPMLPARPQASRAARSKVAPCESGMAPAT